jgi:predicted deacetylase
MTPATWPLYRPLLRKIDAMGGVPASLLLSPASQTGASLADDPRFCAAMDGRLFRGDELVMNGYGPGLGHEGDRQGRAEPRRFSEQEARLRLRAGLHQFIELDWPVGGFVAPGWRLGEGVRAALRRLPFSYTADRESLIDLEDGRQLAAPALVGSDLGAPWQSALPTGRRAPAHPSLGDEPCLRLVIHPMDMQHPDGQGFWIRELDRLLDGRRPMTLTDCLARAHTGRPQ